MIEKCAYSYPVENVMTQLCQARYTCIGLIAVLCLAAWIGAVQEPQKKPQTPAGEVESLIDRLTQIDQQDVGYSASVSGSAFLPLGQSQMGMALLFQEPSASSDTLKSLVKLGAKAVPALLEHLKDDRPTKITLSHGGVFGGMFITQDEDKAKMQNQPGFAETKYTIMVGDLCYVAIGQIVNRPYWAVRYQPTAIVFVTSIPRSKKLRDEVIKEWSNLTPAKHEESLAHDILESGDGYARDSASLRLAYYYPAGLETVALKQLSRPTYPATDVWTLIQERLYPAKTAKDRKALVDEFVTKNGDISREGIKWHLFNDLRSQEADEEGRTHPKLESRPKARECLIDVFGLPAKVKSEDRPTEGPLSDGGQAEFIKTLHYEWSEKLDKALRELLVKTNDDFLAKGCLDRLVGRGYDDEIDAYLKRRLPKQKDQYHKDKLLKYKAKLGWTRLHASVDLDVREIVETVLKQKVPVDTQARDGRTALHIAADNGKTEIIEILLAANANPNIKDRENQLPVQLAAHNDYTSVVLQLVAKKSEVPDIFVATIASAFDKASAMLKAEPTLVKRRNGEGLTPLHVASREGQTEIVRALLAAGADAKAIDDQQPDGKRREYYQGWTPLHLAALKGNTAAATLLLDSGADVNATAKRGQHTPLHYAAWSGSEELVTLLLARNANRNAKDDQRRTPLDLAKEKKNLAVIKLLGK